MIHRDTLFIGGEHIPRLGGDRLHVHSPSTEELIGSTPRPSSADVERAVAAARGAFDHGPWPHLPLEERARLLVAVARRLDARSEEAAQLQVEEMGAPIRFMRKVSSGLTAKVLDQVDAARSVRTRDERQIGSNRVLVVREPIGVVATIVPWNGPLVQVLFKMLAPLLAGNTVIVKPAEEAPLSPYLVADACTAEGVPPGVVSILPGGASVGEQLISDPSVDKVSFTGSTATGRTVARACADGIKSCTLELGGKSAAILLDDADLDRRLPTMLAGAMSNNGQICHSTTRILVSERRHDEVCDRLVAMVRSLVVGDPLDEETDVGPLVSRRQQERVLGYVRAGIDAGATVAAGGAQPPVERGWYVSPTVLVGVDNSMRVAREEIFGPVLCVIPFRDVDDAVRIANDSAYGLGGAVYTEDEETGLSVATRLRTGSVQLNDGPPGGGGGPFGGYKCSGIGRERGVEGHESYYELKSIGLPPRSHTKRGNT